MPTGNDVVPFTTLARLNPPNPSAAGLPADAVVSFIPMSDVSERGEWVSRQTRRLRDVVRGYTGFVEGDVLFAKITPCMENGKGAHALGLENGVGFGSTEFYVLRAEHDVDSRFVYHWTRSPVLRRKAEAFMIGSAGQQRVRPEFFADFRVPLPPVPEQRRVAEILDTLDAAIRATRRIIEKLTQVRHGLLHHLLTGGIDDNGELRNPEQRPGEFKATRLGKLPQTWHVLPLGDLVLVQPSSVDKKSLSGERQVLLCNYMEVYSNEVIHDGLPFTEATASSAEITKFSLAPDDVLITKDSETPDDIAVSAVVRGPLSGTVVCGYHLALLRPQNEQVLGDFLNIALRHRRVNDQFRISANGSTRYGLTTGAIEGAHIPVPPIEEQREIVDRCEAVTRRMSVELWLRDKLEVLKAGVAHDLLTGRVRVAAAVEVVST